jgi:thiamine-phosphate pyrophosphorylase
MAYQFTPAAERALAAAACWTRSNHRQPGDPPALMPLEPPQILLGLLAEAECRAAALLASRGIDAQRVRQRWPQLEFAPNCSIYVPGKLNLAPSTEHALASACGLLADDPRLLVLATEHILLGLAAAGDETAAWLAEWGVRPEPLATEIHERYGRRPDPTPLELPPENDAALSKSESHADASDGKGENGSSSREPRLVVAMLRVLDAAENRAREGLRVIEDYLRFVLDDHHLTELIKHLRHDLAAAASPLLGGDRLAARETQADVGTTITTVSERRRVDWADVLTANFKRVEESLRSLEEYAKLLDRDASARLEQLRYRVYTLERAVNITAASRARLATTQLYVLVDGRESAEEFERLAASLVTAGVHAIQLRDKALDDRPLLARARILRRLTSATPTLFIMNDRPDLAALSGADGVHVGQEELSVKDARTVVGPSALVGVSTHSLRQARQAVLDGADYLGVGPVFNSGTKSFVEFPGLDLLRAVGKEIRLPAFAIGGITTENLSHVLDAGFTRVAVAGAVANAADPALAAQQLLAHLETPRLLEE